MAPSTFRKLTAICLISTTVPTTMALSAAMHAAHTMNLFERDIISERAGLTCQMSGYKQCTQTGLPGNFCCPSTHECQAFNSGQSAICCQLGKDCSTISNISCDVQQQNPAEHGDSELFTTNLAATLPKCGNGCCPQGYSCSNNKECKIASASLIKPSQTSSTSQTSTQTPTSTSKPTTTSPPSSASSTIAPSTTSSSANKAASSQTAAPAHSNPFPPAAILVGLFSGLVAGIILTVAAICFCGPRYKRKETPASPTFSSVSAKVSDPIYQPQGQEGQEGLGRTDFLRYGSTPKYGNRTSKVRSLFSRTPTMKSFKSRDAPVDGIGRSIPAVPKTPVDQRSPEFSPSMKREPSMESIKIYSPPNGGLERPNTTFTDMMADAGFKQGEPYLGSPGRGESWYDKPRNSTLTRSLVDPRSRGIGGV